MDFIEIYDTYYPSVKAYIQQMVKNHWLAEDLAQDTFIKVRNNLNLLRDELKIKSWIFQIARNGCFDYFRRHTNKDVYRNETLDTSIAIQPIAQFQLEQSQMSRCVQDKISLLPEYLQEVIILSRIKGMKQNEISDILEITTGNVKVRLHRARKALKKILKRDCAFDYDNRNVMICYPISAPDDRKASVS